MARGNAAQRVACLMRAGGARDRVGTSASASSAHASSVARVENICSAQSSASRPVYADQCDGDAAALRQLVLRAAARYRPVGLSPYYFARGKLGGDPVFAALLRDGRINDAARIVDIGCGLGILAAWLAVAERCDPRNASDWPPTWAPPPTRWTLRGFDLRRDAIAVGQRALSDLGERVVLTVGDARDVTLPACDVVVMLDVLHYLDTEGQRKLLVEAYDALTPGGALLVRVGDAASHWRAHVTLMVDWWVTIMRDRRWPRLYCRPLSDWKLLLESTGFSAVAQPMSEGTPFANVLLIATKVG